MPQRLSGTSIAEHRGASVIEVLLAVLLLAVIAGLVAFAIRDFSERGTTADCKTDSRTLRTAADAYAGSVVGAGQFTADEGELAATGFLRLPSELHDLALKDRADPSKGVDITVQHAKCGAVGTVIDGRSSF